MSFLPSRVRVAFLLLITLSAGADVVTLSLVQGQTHRSSKVPNLYEARRQVEEYVDSGRYDRDIEKVIVSARVWLDKRVKTARKPAIVLDIDETSLSNWPEMRLNGWARIVNGPCDLEKGPCGHRAWQAMAKAKAIAPTLALAQHAREIGVAVFFITGRPERLRDSTERNLREQGYEWSGLMLEPEGTTFASAVDFKAPERRKIEAQGYTIILNVGDQQSDLTGVYAERTFKLPNPVYFVK
ncbi:MAG TPA: HAD family acid phosphatase [Pyrinomonadaceae bacterium]|jgi:acid phosphatase|nr:HAD family acid phosphatase [Pyrinomonadaceae bacterium]